MSDFVGIDVDFVRFILACPRYLTWLSIMIKI